MTSYVTKKTPGDVSWFTHDRFGMFIHWGLYAMPARHEWIKNREEISEEHYDLYFEHFNPDLYDPKEWARPVSYTHLDVYKRQLPHSSDS